MESNFQNYYTVIAIDRDWDNCFVKFIGIFSNYEFAKSATISHHADFGNTAVFDNKYDYKIFMGNLDEGIVIDAEDDLLCKEKEDKYNELHKEKIEIQRKEDEQNRKKMEEDKQMKMEYVTKIFNKMSCDKDVSELTILEMNHIIDFYDKYIFLITNTNFICNRKFVTESLKNFEYIYKLKIKNNQTEDYLCFIMDVYRKHGIKVEFPLWWV